MRLDLLVLMALLLSMQSAYTQTWEPAARLPGAGALKYIIRHPSGDNLIQMANMPNSPVKGETLLFNLSGLGLESEPYGEQLPYDDVYGGGDHNGNGIPDIQGRNSPPNSGLYMLFDAFSDSEVEFLRPTEGGPFYSGQHQQVAHIDVDSDGYVDIVGPFNNNAYVSYGDSAAPLMTMSHVLVQAHLTETDNDIMFTIRMLGDKLCMMRLVFFGPDENNIRAKYQLLELNSEDLIAHADTLRTALLQEYIVERGAAYYSPVIVSDSVWWIGSNSFTDARMLRMTPSSMEEIVPDRSWVGTVHANPTEQYLIGQWRNGESNPLVIDASRPMLYYWRQKIADTTFKALEYSMIVDVNTLERKRFGLCDLALESADGGSVTATLVPDIDGDGLEDIVTSYFVPRVGSGGYDPVTDMFLSTGNVISSVELNTEPLRSETQSDYKVVETDTYWEIDGAVACGLALTAPIYSVTGSLVGFANLSHGAKLMIYKPATIPTGPLWAVVQSCVIRLR